MAPPKINLLMREWPYAPHHQKVGLIRGEVGLALTTILNPVLGRELLSGRSAALALLSALCVVAFVLIPDGELCSSSMLVNVFLLSIVDANQRLD